MMRTLPFLTLALFGYCCSSLEAQSSFPSGSLPGTNIGGGLPANYEPSGVVWHPSQNRLFVVSDGGIVSRMNSSGGSITNWTPGGNLEGITVAFPSSNFVYLGDETAGTIREFNFVTNQVTRSFNVSAWLNGSDNRGLEALTFVPNSSDPEGGLFYAGLQRTGEVFVFRLPITSSATSTSVSLINTFTPVAGRTDISDLTYDWNTNTIYAIWDGGNRLRQMQTNGNLIQEWILPGSNQEGVALGNGSLYIAEDTSSTHPVMRYDNFVAIPEPATVLLLVLCLAGVLLAFVWHRHRQNRAEQAEVQAITDS